MEDLAWNLPDKTVIFGLKLVGCWPADGIYKHFYTLYSVIPIFGFIIIHNFCQTINIFFIDDLSLATAIIFVALTDAMSMLKSYVLISNTRILKKLTQEITDCEIFQPKNLEQKRLAEVGIKFWHKMYMFFTVTAFFTLLFWGIFPVVDGTYKEYKLPFFTWYPFDFKKSPFYELVYVHQMLSILCIAFVNVPTDLVISALMTFVGVQCEILCDNLRNLSSESDFERKFIDCVKHHREIIRFAQDTNDSFYMLFLAQFCTSTVSLGLSMFQMTVVTPFTNEYYSFVMYAYAVIVQILIYCYFGNEVQFKSSNIPFAAYECNWTEVPLQLKKDLNFFIARTQRPVKFSALNLFFLTLETFTKILRTAYSYFAVLNNMNTSG